MTKYIIIFKRRLLLPSELSLSELFGVELYPLFGVLFANMGRSVWARDAAVNLKCVAVLALLALASPLSASAEPPPTCPKGSGPVKVVDAVAGTRASESHWECREGEFWPTGMFLDESDCPKGTHLEQSREDVCVPLCVGPSRHRFSLRNSLQDGYVIHSKTVRRAPRLVGVRSKDGNATTSSHKSVLRSVNRLRASQTQVASG